MNAHASAVRAAVQRLDDGHTTAAQIAMRLGVSPRQVVRYRARDEAS